MRLRNYLMLPIVGIAGAFGSEAPDFAPRLELYADFTAKTQCPVFRPGEPVELCVRIRGRRSADATLAATVTDWRGRVVHSDALKIPAGGGYRDLFLRLPNRESGYFRVFLKVPETGTVLPRQGSRPAGFVTYAVLPPLELPRLADAVDSRFGAQGFARVNPRDPDDLIGPLYELAGLRWIYLHRRLFDLAGTRPGEFDPEAPGAAWIDHRRQEDSAVRAKLAVFSDLNSVPAWLQNVPPGVDTSRWTPSASHFYQIYAPKDYAAYGDLIGRVVRAQREFRKRKLPGQKRGIYEIHWEPDWHWKGSDAEFIRMYEAAAAAVRANDPEGELLGANYGVLKTGNDHLERLFRSGLGNFLDGIVTHLYYLPMNRSPEEAGTIEEVRRLIAMKNRYLKPGARAVNSEWGVQCSSAFGKTLHDDPSLELRETAWMLRGHLIGLGEGLDTTFFFYLADHDEWGLFFNLNAPYPSFNPDRIAPKLAFCGVATMTRMLEGTKNLGCIDYLAPGAWGYAFERDGRAVAALWSRDEQPRRVHFPTGAERVVVYDAAGGSREVPAPGGIVELELDALPLYVTGVAPSAIPRAGARELRPSAAPEKWDLRNAELIDRDGKIIPIPASGMLPAKLSAGVYAARHPGGTVRIRILPKISMRLSADSVVLVNELASPAVLSLEPEGLPARTLRLAPREARKIPLEFAALPPSSAAHRTVRVRLRDADGAENSAELELENRYSVLPMVRAAKPDGLLSGWNLERFTTVAEESAVKIGAGAWRGPADLSLRYAVAHDALGLYFALRVRDREHRQTRSALDAWAEDSVQIGLGVGRDVESGWKVYSKLCFSADSRTGEKRVYRHNGTGDGRAPGEPSGEGIRFDFSRVGEESFYEIFVPWTALSRGLRPPADGVIGLGILVNDTDDRPDGVSPRRALEVFGGMAEGDPRKLGVAVLRQL